MADSHEKEESGDELAWIYFVAGAFVIGVGVYFSHFNTTHSDPAVPSRPVGHFVSASFSGGDSGPQVGMTLTGKPVVAFGGTATDTTTVSTTKGTFIVDGAFSALTTDQVEIRTSINGIRRLCIERTDKCKTLIE
ncbi:TPA: hypothetical protein ACK3Q6_007676 [Burkholderia cepacia]